MTPEQEVLSDLLAQVTASCAALEEAIGLMGPLPDRIATLEAMQPVERIASTALLKIVEQLEDGIARTFRTILKMQGISLKGLFPLDIANRMVELDILDDAAAWVAVVKLRNELVHEYPLKPAQRLERLIRAYAAAEMLRSTASRVTAIISERGLLGHD